MRIESSVIVSFYGMKAELKSSVRHLFNSPDVSFSMLLTAARRNELEEVEQKPVRGPKQSCKGWSGRENFSTN